MKCPHCNAEIDGGRCPHCGMHHSDAKSGCLFTATVVALIFASIGGCSLSQILSAGKDDPYIVFPQLIGSVSAIIALGLFLWVALKMLERRGRK
jgi:hypothetical protein